MRTQGTGSTPANEMSHLTGLTPLLALGLLAGRVFAAPAPEPRAPASVRFLLILPPHQPF